MRIYTHKSAQRGKAIGAANGGRAAAIIAHGTIGHGEAFTC